MATTGTEMVLFTILQRGNNPRELRVFARVTMPQWVGHPTTPEQQVASAVWLATFNTLQALQRGLPAALAGTPLEGAAVALWPATSYEQLAAQG